MSDFSSLLAQVGIRGRNAKNLPDIQILTAKTYWIHFWPPKNWPTDTPPFFFTQIKRLYQQPLPPIFIQKIALPATPSPPTPYLCTKKCQYWSNNRPPPSTKFLNSFFYLSRVSGNFRECLKTFQCFGNF